MSGMNWARHNRQRMSHLDFERTERRVERWAVRRVSDQAHMALHTTEAAARRFAQWLTNTAPDGETYEHHRRRDI